jgi:2'-5' RNA ligase
MPRRPTSRASRADAGRALALVVLALATGGCATGPAPAAPPPASPPEGAAHPGGALFSTIPCAGTPLGRAWASLRDEAAARFPGLKLARVEDLHLTVVYVGEGWKVEDLEPIRAHALPGPRETVSLRPEVVRMGRHGHVVAVELHGAPGPWTEAVIAARGELTRLGLKKADRYDAAFRPHVTVASARSSPPGEEEAPALEELRSWLAAKAAVDAGLFALTVGPGTPIRLWLAGTPRPPGSPVYVDVDDVLPRP